MCSGTEAGSHLRVIDSCITQLKAQGPSRTCNQSKEEEYEVEGAGLRLTILAAGERLADMPIPDRLKQSCTERYSSQFENNCLAEIRSSFEEGLYIRLIDLCITQL